MKNFHIITTTLLCADVDDDRDRRRENKGWDEMMMENWNIYLSDLDNITRWEWIPLVVYSTPPPKLSSSWWALSYLSAVVVFSLLLAGSSARSARMDRVGESCPTTRPHWPAWCPVGPRRAEHQKPSQEKQHTTVIMERGCCWTTSVIMSIPTH